MSEPDLNPDRNPDLTPEQDDAVRALLAGARHTEPVPPEVRARLDESLASLTLDRRSTEQLETAPVVTLASRRRRRAATAVLAAACVVVLGVGVGQVLPTDTSSDDSAAGSAADSSPRSEEKLSEDRPAPESGGDAELPQEDQELDAAQLPRATAGLPEGPPFALTTATALKPQVRALRAPSLLSSYSGASDCLDASVGEGSRVQVTFDDQPGVLVFADTDARRQRVDLYVCGNPEPVRSVTLGSR